MQTGGWIYQLMYVANMMDSFKSRSLINASCLSRACLADAMHSSLNVVLRSLCGMARWMSVNIERRRTSSDMIVNMAVALSFSLAPVLTHAAYYPKV